MWESNREREKYVKENDFIFRCHRRKEGKKEEEEKIESTKIMFGSRKVLKKEKNMLKKIIFYFILFTMFGFIMKNPENIKYN